MAPMYSSHTVASAVDIFIGLAAGVLVLSHFFHRRKPRWRSFSRTTRVVASVAICAAAVLVLPNAGSSPVLLSWSVAMAVLAIAMALMDVRSRT
jgi:Ni/Fe-hydrogenase subunit HybB-like protein